MKRSPHSLRRSRDGAAMAQVVPSLMKPLTSAHFDCYHFYREFFLFKKKDKIGATHISPDAPDNFGQKRVDAL